MTSFNAGIEAAREKLHHRLADIGGCLDGNCMVVRPKGVHTNGGCQCLKNWTKAQQAVNAYKAFEAEVSTLKRPEPSEDLRVERLAAWLADRFNFAEWIHSSEEERQYWRESAREALKAMEQQEQEV